MAVAWFVAQYKRNDDKGEVIVGSAIRDYAQQVAADNGALSEVECLGGYAIWKVRASLPTLQAIAADPLVRRLPKDHLDDALADLTSAQQTAVKTLLTDAGYTNQQIRSALGNDLTTKTLRDVLLFLASRRRLARFDAPTNTVVWDGPVQSCRPLSDADDDVLGG